MIIEHCFYKNYLLIACFNSIYFIQAAFVFLYLISESHILRAIIVMIAILILIIELYLFIIDNNTAREKKVRLMIILSNLIVIYKETKSHKPDHFFELDGE